MSREEHGAATVLALAMMGLLVSVALAVTAGVAVVAAHRTAQSAADLAALAGASALQDGGDPCTRATALAARNRAVLRSCDVAGWDVRVVVSAAAHLPVGDVTLRARSRAGPTSSLEPGG